MRISVWVAVVCADAGQVLAARRAAHTRNGGQWNFFGGGLDAGETPEQTALRELHEEAGISASAQRLRYVGESMSRGKLNHLFALPVEHLVEPRLNRESQDWRWFQLHELRAHRRLHAPTERLTPLLCDWLNDQTPPPSPLESAAAPLPPHLTWDWLLRRVPQVWPFRRI